jgi:hypothetical protein
MAVYRAIAIGLVVLLALNVCEATETVCQTDKAPKKASSEAADQCMEPAPAAPGPSKHGHGCLSPGRVRAAALRRAPPAGARRPEIAPGTAPRSWRWHHPTSCARPHPPKPKHASTAQGTEAHCGEYISPGQVGAPHPNGQLGVLFLCRGAPWVR